RAGALAAGAGTCTADGGFPLRHPVQTADRVCGLGQPGRLGGPVSWGRPDQLGGGALCTVPGAAFAARVEHGACGGSAWKRDGGPARLFPWGAAGGTVARTLYAVRARPAGQP